jgi:alpha-beta hydrolase superfamily lysophospholipase
MNMNINKNIRSEGFFTGYHDAKLYYQKWVPENPKATLVITHGQGEHSESYLRLVDALAGMGLQIIAWDWRGHGRSDGKRGYAGNFQEYCDDYEIFLKECFKDEFFQKHPRIVLGHSMGGLIQLKSLASHPEWSFTAQVLSSPFLGMALKVPAIKEVGAQFLYSFLPTVTLWNEIKDEMLSRDPEVLKEFPKDILRHNRISSGVFLGALESIKYVQERADRFALPTLLQIPSKDLVVSSDASQEFFKNLKCEKNLKVYTDYTHEIYNDLGRDKVYADLKEFLKKYIS